MRSTIHKNIYKYISLLLPPWRWVYEWQKQCNVRVVAGVYILSILILFHKRVSKCFRFRKKKLAVWDDVSWHTTQQCSYNSCPNCGSPCIFSLFSSLHERVCRDYLNVTVSKQSIKIQGSYGFAAILRTSRWYKRKIHKNLLYFPNFDIRYFNEVNN